jgi:hypothetical protein
LIEGGKHMHPGDPKSVFDTTGKFIGWDEVERRRRELALLEMTREKP